MRRKATLTEGGGIVIPPEIRRALGIEEGDVLVFEVNETGVHLLAPEASDPFEQFRGIRRDRGPMTLEQIIAEQRKMRGWDEYDYWLAEQDDRH